MLHDLNDLPCPLPHCVDLTTSDDPIAACESLPAAAGVFVMLDANASPLCLVATKDIRRLVRTRLKPADPEAPVRRIDYASLTATVRAVTVGSAFEADWVYLLLARRVLPATYRSLLDHWRGWFIHCNSDTDFPRFQKTASPGTAPTGRTGVYLGPFADKHAAARYMDVLDDAFDLCRYYHILVEAPNGRACAYKEMGKCPAPCDGSITMDAYREQIRSAVRFARSSVDQFVDDLELEMHNAAEAQEFERAAALKRRVTAVKPASRAEFRWVRDLQDFRFLLVTPSECDGWARVWLINGGRIEPICDVSLDLSKRALGDLCNALDHRCSDQVIELDDHCIENIGLVCRHLFMPKAKQPRVTFLRYENQLDPAAVRRALKRAQTGETAGEIGEHELSADSAQT